MAWYYVLEPEDGDGWTLKHNGEEKVLLNEQHGRGTQITVRVTFSPSFSKPSIQYMMPDFLLHLCATEKEKQYDSFLRLSSSLIILLKQNWVKEYSLYIIFFERNFCETKCGLHL